MISDEDTDGGGGSPTGYLSASRNQTVSVGLSPPPGTSVLPETRLSPQDFLPHRAPQCFQKTKLSPQDFLPHQAPQCFQKTKLSPQDFLSLRLWLQSPDSAHTLWVPPPVRGSGLETRSFLKDKGRNHRGNRSVDANTQTWGHGVSRPPS